MPVQVKICGLSTPETLDAAVAGGASHVGLVFYPKSPRNVGVDLAASLCVRVSGRAKVVGLFVDPEPAFIDAVRGPVRLDVIQLHGGERPAQVANIRARNGIEVWKALPVRSTQDLHEANKYRGASTRILYDSKPQTDGALPGGTGLRFDWKLLEGFAHPLPWVLAGGLDAGNLKEAVGVTGARLVDVSSGVESAPGVKDVDKIAAFLESARNL